MNKLIKYILFSFLVVIFVGCVGSLAPKTMVKVDNTYVIVGYEKVKPEWNCTFKGADKFNPNTKSFGGYFVKGSDGQERSRQYFAKKANKLGANYVNKDFESRSTYGGFYSESSTEHAKMYFCKDLPKEEYK